MNEFSFNRQKKRQVRKSMAGVFVIGLPVVWRDDIVGRFWFWWRANECWWVWRVTGDSDNSTNSYDSIYRMRRVQYANRSRAYKFRQQQQQQVPLQHLFVVLYLRPWLFLAGIDVWRLTRDKFINFYFFSNDISNVKVKLHSGVNAKTIWIFTIIFFKWLWFE